MNKKKQKSSTIMLEIERVQKNNAVCAERLAKLKKEHDSNNTKLKELQKLYDSLQQEELLEKISQECIKDNKLTEEQILTLIALNKQIVENINILDADTVMGAIMDTSLIATKKQPKAEISALQEDKGKTLALQDEE
jgi:DNA-binding transcriptional regulator YbjK